MEALHVVCDGLRPSLFVQNFQKRVGVKTKNDSYEATNIYDEAAYLCSMLFIIQFDGFFFS